MDIDPDVVSDAVFLAGMVLVAFGIGFRWDQFMSTGNYITPLGYGAVLFYAGVKVWRRMQETE